MPVCFSSMDGMPFLVNQTMNEVCNDIFGTTVRNTNECDRRLEEGEVRPGIHIDSTGSGYIVKTSKGVWDIKYTFHDHIKEITAVNITEEYHLTEEIREGNERLFRVNERLREYSSKVDSYMREKEILAAKIKVHDDIGRFLIALKTYLNEDSGDRESLIRLWKNSILLMRGDAEAHKEAD